MLKLMLQSAFRYVIALALGWLVAKGIISSDDSAKYLPDLVNFAALTTAGVLLLLWSFIQKKLQGLIPDNTENKK